MNVLPIDAITVPATRQRREFDEAKLQELVTSLEENGLLQAIVLRQENGTHVLVSGERRLRAIKDIFALGGSLRHDNQVVPEGCIPYTLIEALDPFTRELAELDENLRRADLTWQEHAEAVARVAALRAAQAAANGTTPPTTVQLAEELFQPARNGFEDQGKFGQETVRQQIAIAPLLADPDIAKARTLTDAFKIAKRKESARRDAALAAKIGPTFNNASHQCIEADALAWLASCESELYDCILTDPPYGIDADEFGDSGGKAVSDHRYGDSPGVFRQLLSACCDHFSRVTKPQAHLYWFCDIDRFHELRAAFTATGWWVHRTPIVWSKPLANGIPWPEHGPRRTWELILYAVKGRRPILKPSAADLIVWPSDPNLGHSAQKPVGLFRELLGRTCRPGDAVLDPFCGTGPVFPAAHELKVRATGIERDPAARGIALRRLEALV